MDPLENLVTSVWDTKILNIGGAELTVGTIIWTLGVMTAVFVAISWLRRMILKRLTRKLDADQGTLYSVSVIAQYVVGIIAFVVIIQAAGIDLSTLTVIFGALGIGIGFGLQSIINNFVSGIVILIERPVKVGDRVEIGDLEGDITEIALRATTVMTNEGIAVIVPNSHLVSQQVVNRSLQDRRIRFKLPVGVDYSSDPEQVKEVLLQVAANHPGVMQHPEPRVIFESFGDSSLNFFLWVWTHDYINRPYIFRSEMNFAIHAAFKEAGIKIPFPQRDLHLRSSDIGGRISDI